MKVTINSSVAPTPAWPVGAVALVRKKGQSDNVAPFARFHAADYDRNLDAPNSPSRIINLATGSVRYESVDDYVVLQVFDNIQIS